MKQLPLCDLLKALDTRVCKEKIYIKTNKQKDIMHEKNRYFFIEHLF